MHVFVVSDETRTHKTLYLCPWQWHRQRCLCFNIL